MANVWKCSVVVVALGACWVAVAAQRVQVEAPVMLEKPAYTAPDPAIAAISSGLDESIDMSKYVDPNDPTKTIVSIDEIMGIGGSKNPTTSTSYSGCSKDHVACQGTCNWTIVMTTCEELAKECKCQAVDGEKSADQESAHHSSTATSMAQSALSAESNPDADAESSENDDSGAASALGVHSAQMVGIIAMFGAIVARVVEVPTIAPLA